MRQVTDNFENLVEIQIFLQFALGSVKVVGDYCFFVSVCGFFYFLFLIPLCLKFYATLSWLTEKEKAPKAKKSPLIQKNLIPTD